MPTLAAILSVSVWLTKNRLTEWLTEFFRLTGLGTSLLSYGSLCDFLGFIPELTWRSNDVGSRKDVPFRVKIATF